MLLFIINLYGHILVIPLINTYFVSFRQYNSLFLNSN